MSHDDIEILLVEDNKTDAELTIRVFKKHGFINKLLWVQDGVEALNFVFGKNEYEGKNINHSLKVILLDLRLPKIDGLEVIKELKSNESTNSIPIIVLTSSKEDMDLLESQELGVNGFMTKPVEFESFIKVVSKIGFSWLLADPFLNIDNHKF